MTKQFATKQEFDKWILEKTKPKTFEDAIMAKTVSDDEIIAMLIADGYSDLYNLVADGHAYQIGKYKNGGWLYEDEADVEYINSTGSHVELKRRSL